LLGEKGKTKEKVEEYKEVKEFKVLQITDAKGGELNYYSGQVEIILNGKHISENNLFLTSENIIVDIDNDIDETDRRIKKAIEAGAFIKKMYYVEDNMFSEHINNFNLKGKWSGVEYAEEHGIVFDFEKDALSYEKYISLTKEKVEVNGYEVIEKQNAIRIVEEIPVEGISKLLINKQKYKQYGAVCYLDLEDGVIKVAEDTTKLMETDIIINKLDKNDIFGGCIVNGEYVKEYKIAMLSSLLELNGFRQAIEEFYTVEA
jgi:hypothetical protein